MPITVAAISLSNSSFGKKANDMTSQQILSQLGFTIGQEFQLNAAKDWSFKFPPGKKHTALVGLAIDGKIKHLLSLKTNLDVKVPLNQYAPYDLFFEGLHIDIKSFSKKTVSISENEIRLGRRLFAQGADMAYALFEQVEGGREYEEKFIFRGFVLLSDLVTHKELKESTLDGGSYFFVANVSNLLLG